jgi:Na+/phosphate symporter
VYLAFAVTAFYIGVGLWRLVPASRLVAIGVYVIGCLNTMLFYALPGREERYHRMISEASQRWHFPETSAQPQQFLIGAWLGIIGPSVLAAIAIYYLVTRRFAFQTASTVVPSDQPPVLPAN